MGTRRATRKARPALVCDGCGAVYRSGSFYVFELRARAEKDGWRFLHHTHTGTRQMDFCPDCDPREQDWGKGDG
jgi:hypothetical protein